MLPSMFENLLISTSDVHDYSTWQANLIDVQYASTKRSQRTIKHSGTKLCNSLCNVIDIDCEISTYKQRLKDFLLPWSLPILCPIVYPYFVFIFIFIIIIFINLFYYLHKSVFICILCSFLNCIHSYLHPAPCFPAHHIYMNHIVYMNLGHISIFFCPLCQSYDTIALVFQRCHLWYFHDDLAWLMLLSV